MSDPPAPLTRTFTRGLLGVCPHCGKTRMFRGMYVMHSECGYCGLPLENKAGEFTGAAYLNTVFSGLLGTVVAIALAALTGWSTLTVVLITAPLFLLVIFGIHRPIKGGWVALLYTLGAIRPPTDIPADNPK